MYSLRWQTQYKDQTLVVDFKSLFEIAKIFENSKIKFKVYRVVDGVGLTQNQLGYGDFNYWLNPHEAF